MRKAVIQFLIILMAACSVAAAVRFPFIRDSLTGKIYFQKPREFGSAPVITLSEARDLLDRNGALFVDARERESYNEGHIKGALSLPATDFSGFDNDPRFTDFRNSPVVVYCSSVNCPASYTLAEYMKRSGFTRVSVYEGGWLEWNDAGYPTEK